MRTAATRRRGGVVGARRFWLFRRGDGADPATGDLSWFLHGLF